MEAYITAGAAVLVAIIEAVAAWDRKQARMDRERTAKRAQRRAEESRLAMSLMSASCALGLITAKKLTGMHTNGDVEAAMLAARAAQEQYQMFLERQASDQVAKV